MNREVEGLFVCEDLSHLFFHILYHSFMEISEIANQVIESLIDLEMMKGSNLLPLDNDLPSCLARQLLQLVVEMEVFPDVGKSNAVVFEGLLRDC